jgi:hypothetical protein
MGFVKDAPPSTSPWEFTPGRAVARPSVRHMPSGPLVPSLSFHPTPTVYSSQGFAGLLHPAADPGVRCVSILACTTPSLPIGRTRRSGISPTARALRSFSLASSSDASPRPRALPPSLSRYVLSLSCDSDRLYLGRSTSGLCSTCEAAANAPPLPVECCPLLPWASRSRVCLVRPVTRQSYGLTAFGKPIAGGLLVHPRRTLGQQPPSPMVLIGSAEQSRRAARPERRRSQRRPTHAFAHATRFVLVGGGALGALLVHCRFGIRRHRPRPTFRLGSQYTPHRQSTRKAPHLGLPRAVFGKASLASFRATARLTSRSDLSSSLVDMPHRCR